MTLRVLWDFEIGKERGISLEERKKDVGEFDSLAKKRRSII